MVSVFSKLKVIFVSLLPESQFDFRAGGLTVNKILTQRKLQEKTMEQLSLYIAFVNFFKVFDTSDHQKFTNIIRQLHSGKVPIGGGASKAFPIRHEVKKSCELAFTLFAWYLG